MSKNSQSGFTLIELLIVVLIIGILASIAIPVFNGQRTKAKNSVAQSTVRNAMTAASSYYTNNESFTTADSASQGLPKEDSSVSVGADSATTAGKDAEDKRVYVVVPTGGASITLCAASKGDRVYCAKQDFAATNKSWQFSKGSSSTATIADVSIGTNATTGW